MLILYLLIGINLSLLIQSYFKMLPNIEKKIKNISHVLIIKLDIDFNTVNTNCPIGMYFVTHISCKMQRSPNVFLDPLQTPLVKPNLAKGLQTLVKYSRLEAACHITPATVTEGVAKPRGGREQNVR